MYHAAKFGSSTKCRLGHRPEAGLKQWASARMVTEARGGIGCSAKESTFSALPRMSRWTAIRARVCFFVYTEEPKVFPPFPFLACRGAGTEEGLGHALGQGDQGEPALREHKLGLHVLTELAIVGYPSTKPLISLSPVKSLYLSLLAWCVVALASTQAAPILSEFLASNRDNLATASGKTEDWIEIKNAGSEAVNLAGYFLTDDTERPQRWALPAVDLAPGAFLVVFASGDDLADPAGELHANFSLAQAGGYLALTAPDGAVVSAYENYPPQRTDISFGMAGSDPAYFETPTPGEENASDGLLGFVADTKFSQDRGYYEEPIEVAIETETSDATIIYTTDGRVPSKGSVFTGTIGEIYSGPITIDRTTTLRAIALKDGFRPSNVDTQTYLFLADVVRQTGEHLPQDWNREPADYEMDPRVVDDPRYKDTIIEDFKTLPSLSIVLEPDDFFSTSKGIYPGKIGEDGIDKPCSAELLHPDGKEGFQIDCAVRIVGQTSPNRWKIKKLSMRLRFDKEFGPGTLRYPLYDDPTAVEEFNTLTVDARHNNTWAYQGGSEPTEQRRRAQYLRDQTAADLHRAMGGFSPHGRYVHTYVNGVYWGMYNLHERPDDAFNATYQGGERDEWVDLRHGTVVVSGDRAPYTALHNMAREADTAEGYAAIEEILDVDDFISYMLVNLGLGNGDWGPKNYYVSYNPVDPNGKWRYHSWDAEKVFQNLNDDVTGRNDSGGPTGLHQLLSDNDDYRIRFADHVYKQFYNGGVMSVEGLQRAYKRRTDEIDRAIILESARWGDAANGVNTPYTKEDWDEHRDWIMNDYFPNRVDIATEQFRNRGLLGDLDLPTFEDHGGHFDDGYAVKIKKSIFAKGDIYYTIDGSDPRLPGGDLSEDAIPYTEPVALAETATVKARLFKGSIFGAKEWSPLLEARFVIGAVPATAENLAITMINYHPPVASEVEKAAGYTRKAFEFVGLRNLGDQAVSLLGLELIEGIRFDFDEGELAQIGAGETAFLVKNRAAFESRYGGEHLIIGVYTGSLSNDGERLLLQAGHEPLADFVFNDAGDWPEGTDGDGAYLVLENPGTSTDSSKAGSWRASTAEDVPAAVGGGGDPGGGGGLAYADWSASAFAAGATKTEPNEDADGDRFVNYLEFLLGGDPEDASSVPRFDVVPQPDGLPIFEVSHRVGVSEPVLFETGRTLDDWSEVSAAALEELGARPGPDASVEIRRYRVLQLTKDAVWTERFVRVKAVVPGA